MPRQLTDERHNLPLGVILLCHNFPFYLCTKLRLYNITDWGRDFKAEARLVQKHVRLC